MWGPKAVATFSPIETTTSMRYRSQYVTSADLLSVAIGTGSRAWMRSALVTVDRIAWTKTMTTDKEVTTSDVIL